MTFASMPPKRRNEHYDCHSEGHPCWVHEHYPFAWVLTLVVAVATGAFLLGLYVKHLAEDRAANRPSTSEP